MEPGSLRSILSDIERRFSYDDRIKGLEIKQMEESGFYPIASEFARLQESGTPFALYPNGPSSFQPRKLLPNTPRKSSPPAVSALTPTLDLPGTSSETAPRTSPIGGVSGSDIVAGRRHSVRLSYGVNPSKRASEGAGPPSKRARGAKNPPSDHASES